MYIHSLQQKFWFHNLFDFFKFKFFNDRLSPLAIYNFFKETYA